MATKTKETRKEGITVATYRARPILVLPPYRTRAEWAEHDRQSQVRMSHYPVATKSVPGLHIVVGLYDDKKK